MQSHTDNYKNDSITMEKSGFKENFEYWIPWEISKVSLNKYLVLCWLLFPTSVSVCISYFKNSNYFSYVYEIIIMLYDAQQPKDIG